MTSMAPIAVSQKLTALRKGKATSRAPICWGITMFHSPTRNGMAMNRIMMVPWALKICAKWSGGR